MRSNRLSSLIGFTTFGESHGEALGIVIEDIKPNIDFPFEQLNKLLSQRKPGKTAYSTTRQENDTYQVISGVFEGKTTGMPICILFWNKDAKPDDYTYLKDLFRPGHAEFGLFNKFKIYDYRGGGRSSGRETISRVAASALVNEYIKPIEIRFQTNRIGNITCSSNQYYFVNQDNPFCWGDEKSLSELYHYLDVIKADQDTVGGIINVRIDKVPVGLGDPVFEKLNANLAKAIMSIGSVKAVSFGDGFALAALKGSEANDQMDKDGFLSNHTGGITGGISTGQPINISIAVKPISSHGRKQKTINKNGIEQELIIKGRHDVCHIPRIIPVIEAMIKLSLVDAITWQNKIDNKESTLDEYRETLDKLDEDILLLIYRRKKVVQQVKEFKVKNNLPPRDFHREDTIEAVCKSNAEHLGLDNDKVTLLIHTILDICRDDNTYHTV